MSAYKLIVMIPARLGSKRIPKKNIRFMADKPLIKYPIDLCSGCELIDEIWVNTESEELGNFAEQNGAKWHKRPEYLAGDNVTNREFTYEFLQRHECDYVIMVNPTSPLLRHDTLRNFLQFVNDNNFDSVVSVISEKAETFFEDKPLNFSLDEKINSQLLEPVEKIVWALTAWKRSTYIKMQDQGDNPVYGGNLGKFIIPKDESCDLDTEDDWRIAEGILQSRQMYNEPSYLEL